MATYKPQSAQIQGFADSPYSQYSTQSFSSHQTDNTGGQLNQIPYGASTGGSVQYGVTAQGMQGINLSVLSCHPAAGAYGTKLTVKVSSQYDLYSMGPSPYASVVFGTRRAAAQLARAGLPGAGCFTYAISANVPQFASTGCTSSNNVPFSLLLELNGEEVARVENAGFFTYHDTRGGSSEGAGAGAGSSADENSHDGRMRRSSQSQDQSPEQRTSPSQQDLCIRTTAATSPVGSQHNSPIHQATNSYGYPANDNAAAAAAQVQAQAQADSNYAAASGALNQESGSMLGYRSSGYGHYPPALRSRRGSGWSPYSSHYDAVGGRVSANTMGHTVTRPSLTHSPHNHNPNGPQLIRTSTLSTIPGGGGMGGSGYGNNIYGIFPAKATLEIKGDLSTMVENWTAEEWENRRRIVLFKKSQHGSQLQCSFRPVSVNERPPNSILVSCIYWAEKQEFFVTSVDTIHLLEQLVAAPPSRFTVEEKNRIRRNLEGLHPITVSKSKAESEEFFKVIMGFGAPKPRNIEKDVKVFPWRILDQALKKIISKYSAPAAASQYQPMPPPVLTPVSVANSYPVLPPTPVTAPGSNEPPASSGYMHSAQSHHGEPNSRPLSAVSSNWIGSYAPNRTVSPGIRTHSPANGSTLRVSTLPSIYDPRTSAQQPMPSSYSLSGSSNGNHTHAAQHSQASYSLMPLPGAHSRNWDGRAWDANSGPRNMEGRAWDGYGVSDSYANHASHPVHNGQPPVYGASPYGDSAQRA